jgi:hypothetical protein
MVASCSLFVIQYSDEQQQTSGGIGSQVLSFLRPCRVDVYSSHFSKTLCQLGYIVGFEVDPELLQTLHVFAFLLIHKPSQ